MPQIAQILETYSSQIFWLLIVFGLLYFGIAKGMLSKVDANVDARDRKIADDLAAAEKARAEADKLEDGGDADIAAARADAQTKTNEAKAKAAKEAETRLAAADAEVGAKLAAAEKELAKATAKAMTSIETVASEAAADIVAKVSGTQVSTAQATNAVKAILANG